ncbi:MAG: GNAT family N-acetyltransferase [Thaumarchaeota archaeon]|jgi:ribosomal protein S18 acetylase RimI-like enzyme|nr:GNAT family N-acetyltransferase [Nitrososphaerota archaeon]
MNIRKVVLSDIESFVDLYVLSYKGLEEYAYTQRKDIEDYFKWLLKRDSEGFLIVEMNEPVAFVACDANWFSGVDGEIVGEIHELFVHPNYRRRGIGSTLVEKAVDYARRRNRRTMGLWVGVKNLSAKEFYREMGFIERLSLGKWTRMIKILEN